MTPIMRNKPHFFSLRTIIVIAAILMGVSIFTGCASTKSDEHGVVRDSKGWW